MASNNKFILVVLTVMASIILEQKLGTIMVVGMPGQMPPNQMPRQSTDDVKIEKVTPKPQFTDLRRFSNMRGGFA